ncbi:hypothetical protein ZWY2020_025948 [Hordeum vulgare]|nr:hypothetical protein ZWY2020_025948 [Hordeum vulgare]
MAEEAPSPVVSRKRKDEVKTQSLSLQYSSFFMCLMGCNGLTQTVIATGEYKEPITQKDVADYAMKMINAGGKDVNAQKFVDNLKERYGNGIAVKCLLYNATGATLNFAKYNDWHGHIYDTPYPSDIQNGQWGAFLHVHPSGAAAGSAGAVVYRSKIPSSSSSCDWLFSWTVPHIGGNG